MHLPGSCRSPDAVVSESVVFSDHKYRYAFLINADVFGYYVHVPIDRVSTNLSMNELGFSLVINCLISLRSVAGFCFVTL